MTRPTVALLLLLVIFLHACFRTAPESSADKQIDQSPFDTLLSRHVDERGMVDYEALKKDHELLKTYLRNLSAHTPGHGWSEDDKLAYWINVYNAYTLELILRHPGIESIKDITPVSVSFILSPWQVDFIPLGAEMYNLDDIEHGIIRKSFNEPRIHFALVCAAFSCPPLRREAYRGEILEQQLDDQARRFLNDRTRNDIRSGQLHLSKLFDWYADDFTAEGTLIDFIQPYVPFQIRDDADITFMDYSWRLNSQHH